MRPPFEPCLRPRLPSADLLEHAKSPRNAARAALRSSPRGGADLTLSQNSTPNAFHGASDVGSSTDSECSASLRPRPGGIPLTTSSRQAVNEASLFHGLDSISIPSTSSSSRFGQ